MRRRHRRHLNLVFSHASGRLTLRRTAIRPDRRRYAIARCGQMGVRHVWVWNPYINRITRPIDAVESRVRHHSLDSDDSLQSHKLCRMYTRNCRSLPVRRQTMTTHTARRHSSSRALPQDSFDHNWSMNRWSSSKSQHSRSFSSCTR